MFVDLCLCMYVSLQFSEMNVHRFAIQQKGTHILNIRLFDGSVITQLEQIYILFVLNMCIAKLKSFNS